MTMPTTTAPTPIPLPEPGYPMLARLITDQIFASELKTKTVECPRCKQGLQIKETVAKDEPIVWVLSKPHPLMPTMTVVRMFIEDAVVVVYAAADDGMGAIRNVIPLRKVRLAEEVMPLDVFVEEMTAAENGGDDGDDDELDEPEEGTPEAPAAGSPVALVPNN